MTQSQAETLALALRLLEHAPGPRTTVQSPQRWSDEVASKVEFQGNVDYMSAEEIADAGRVRQNQRGWTKGKRRY